MSFTVVTVTNTYVNSTGGSPGSGADDDLPMPDYIVFTPLEIMQNGTETSDLEPITVFPSAGVLSVNLLANDDIGTLPLSGPGYSVFEVLGNVKGPVWYFKLSHTTNPLNLSSVNRLTSPPS